MIFQDRPSAYGGSRSGLTHDRRWRTGRISATLLLFVAVLLFAAGGAASWFYFVRLPLRESQSVAEALVLRSTGLNKPVSNKLDARFKDADGDLIADAPVDAAALVDPEKLVFCYIPIETPELHEKAFADLTRRLTEVTGKPVEYLPVKSTEEQLAAMRDGKLHVAGFNTGAVPVAVNLAGFVPVSTLGGDTKGTGKAVHQMEMLVPSGSTAASLADLRGSEVTFVATGSQSGYRTPLVVLAEAGLLPQRDYTLRYSGGQEESILGVASHKYSSAAVANDVVKRLIGTGRIKAEQVRSIYKSESFPNAALGYAYNLKPELAAKIRKTLLEFEWKGTSLEAFFGPAGQTRFLPVAYKDDFALARRIDDSCGFKYGIR